MAHSTKPPDAGFCHSRDMRLRLTDHTITRVVTYEYILSSQDISVNTFFLKKILTSPNISHDCYHGKDASNLSQNSDRMERLLLW